MATGTERPNTAETADNKPQEWQCPNCPWMQRAHPVYGWGFADDRAVWVHQNILCSNRRTPPEVGGNA